MNLFTITGRNGYRITVERNITTNKVEIDNRIEFIKIIKDAFNCNLKDAHDFEKQFTKQMNDLKTTEEAMRNRINDELNKVDNVDDLRDVLRFVFNCIDYPKQSSIGASVEIY